MAETVLVVHGIANRSEKELEDHIAFLETKTNGAYEFIGCYWGDLGGISEGLEDALPVMRAVQQTAISPMKAAGMAGRLAEVRQELMGVSVVSEQEVAQILSQVIRDQLGLSAHVAKANQLAPDGLEPAILEEIKNTNALVLLTPDELQDAGKLMAEFIRAERSDPSTAHLKGVNAALGISDWTDYPKDAFRRFLGRLDAFAGRLISNGGGGINQGIRRALSDGVAQTLGDIVVYHEKKAKLHSRLFERLRENDKTLGSEENPVTVLAHSLGGIICLDAALGCEVFENGEDGEERDETLHIKRFLTFGTQAAFFHIISPRSGISQYKPGSPVELPSTIGRWCNLWHPLDILAFTAGKVFKFSDGTAPADYRIDSTLSEEWHFKGWLHSSYWSHPMLIEKLKSF